MKQPIQNPPQRLRQRWRARASAWRIWWEPAAELRELGFEPVELDPKRLTWSVREAERLNDLVDQARSGAPAQPGGAQRGRTVAAAIRAYRTSPDWDALKPATQRDYTAAFRLIERKWGSSLVVDFTGPVVRAWYETLYRDAGHHQALALVRKLSVLMSYSVLAGWRADNPCLRLKLRTPAGRSRIAGWPELDALFVAAREMALPSMALAIALAVYQGQRQKDVLEAMRADVAGDVWRLVRSKRGNHGALQLHPEIAPHLQKVLATSTGPQLLISEGTGRAYSANLLRSTWARLRERAAKSEPTLATLQFRDLRRTFGHLSRLGGASERDVADALGNGAWKDPKLSGVYMPADAETASRAVAAIARPGAETLTPLTLRLTSAEMEALQAAADVMGKDTAACAHALLRRALGVEHKRAS